MITDEYFHAMRVIRPTRWADQTNQNLETTGDLILRTQIRRKAGQRWDIISICEWNGSYVAKIKVNSTYELEHVYMAGSRLYAGIYANSSQGRRNFLCRLLSF